MQHDHRSFLREQAERCQKLARMLTEPKLAEELKAIAQAFLDKASELEREEP